MRPFKRVGSLAIVVVALAIFAGGAWIDQRAQARAEANLSRDRAAVEVAATTLTYEDVSEAWTDQLLHRSSRLRDIQESVPVRWAAAHEDEGAIILVFRSADSCIDLLVRPTGNTVRTRSC